MVFGKCVIRICDKIIYYKKFNNYYNIIKNLDCKYLEKIYQIDEIDDYVYILSKKLMPIIDTDFSLKKEFINCKSKIINDIHNAINILLDNDMIHCDVRLDNVGYDKTNGNFVLIDFDSINTRITDRYYDDKETLKKSIKMYFSI